MAAVSRLIAPKSLTDEAANAKRLTDHSKWGRVKKALESGKEKKVSPKGIVDYWQESMPKVSSYNGVAALLGDNEAAANDVPDSPPHRRRGGSKIERTSSFEDPDGKLPAPPSDRPSGFEPTAAPPAPQPEPDSRPAAWVTAALAAESCKGGQALHPAEQAVAQLMLSLEAERERASALQAKAAEAAEAAKEMELRAVKAEARLEIAAAATKQLLAANEALQGAKQGKAPGPIAKALSTILSPGKGKESDDGAVSSPSVVY